MEKFEIKVKKGEKEKIKAHAESRGMSLNAFIVEAIEKELRE